MCGKKMLVQRGADERSADGSGRVLAWPGPRTRARARDLPGATRPPKRDAEARTSPQMKPASTACPLSGLIGQREKAVTQLSRSKIPDGFAEKTAQANGITLNYAIGGAGPAVVLVHGYPQTWYMWRKVMPAL